MFLQIKNNNDKWCLGVCFMLRINFLHKRKATVIHSDVSYSTCSLLRVMFYSQTGCLVGSSLSLMCVCVCVDCRLFYFQEDYFKRNCFWTIVVKYTGKCKYTSCIEWFDWLSITWEPIPSLDAWCICAISSIFHNTILNTFHLTTT